MFIRHNNTRKNCILNVQDGVQQKLCFISFLDTFFFCCCSISIKWISSCILHVFTFGICNFRHVGFHVRILVMRITVEVVPAPRVIPLSCERTSFQNRETRAHRDIPVDHPRYPCPPRYPCHPRYPCPRDILAPRDIPSPRDIPAPRDTLFLVYSRLM